MNSVLNQISNDNSSCILKIPAGCGFHSITGDWQFDDFSINKVKTTGRGSSRGELNGNNSVKSRKISTDGKKFEMMRFVKLTVLTDEIVAQRESECNAKKEAELKTEKERQRKEKEDQECIEAEKLAKIEAERKAEAERIAKEKQENEEAEARQMQKEEELEQKTEGLAKQLDDIDNFDAGRTIIANSKNITDGVPESESIKLFLLRAYETGYGGKNRWRKIKKLPGIL